MSKIAVYFVATFKYVTTCGKTLRNIFQSSHLVIGYVRLFDGFNIVT